MARLYRNMLPDKATQFAMNSVMLTKNTINKLLSINRFIFYPEIYPHIRIL
jgi:hypothetical protein